MMWKVEEIAGDISYFNNFKGGTLYQIYERESIHLESAAKELVEQGKVTNESALMEKIDHRYQLMKKYREKQYRDLDDRVEKVLENAENKRDENLDK